MQIGDATAYVVVGVPPDFVEKMIHDIDSFQKEQHLDEKAIEKLLGRAGRLAYLIPAAKPFTSMLWAAKAATDSHCGGRARRYPLQRFAKALYWIRTLLRPPRGSDPWLPLQHIMANTDVSISLDTAPAVEFDASPWDYGYLLKSGSQILEYGYGQWATEDAAYLGIAIGKPASQTVFEYLALFIVLVCYGHAHRSTGLAILGDNLASLNLALSMKGSAALGTISRELTWRRIRGGWRYACGHLPTEQNTVADQLSRLHQPGHPAQLPDVLREARRHPGLRVSALWTPGL